MHRNYINQQDKKSFARPEEVKRQQIRKKPTTFFMEKSLRLNPL